MNSLEEDVKKYIAALNSPQPAGPRGTWTMLAPMFRQHGEDVVCKEMARQFAAEELGDTKEPAQ